jgi:hypothetical protein
MISKRWCRLRKVTSIYGDAGGSALGKMPLLVAGAMPFTSLVIKPFPLREPAVMCGSRVYSALMLQPHFVIQPVGHESPMSRLPSGAPALHNCYPQVAVAFSAIIAEKATATAR